MSVQYYEDNAATFFENTSTVNMDNIYKRFLPLLDSGCSILDAGCGSGRDTKFFAQNGFKVQAFDASKKMVELASEYTGESIKFGSFESISYDFKFDAIWCCASLLHVAESNLKQSISNLLSHLKANGVIYMSFKYGDKERVKGGRKFTDMNEERLSALITTFPLIEEKLWITEDNRTDRSEKWLNIILRKFEL